MVAKWTEFDPAALFPQEMADLMSIIQSTANTVGTAVDLLADVADLVALIAQGLMDAQTAVVAALRQAVYAVIQQLQTTGVYWTWHLPISFTDTLTPARWCNDVAASFDDLMDEDRPMMPTPAFVGMVAIVGTTGSFGDLLGLLEKLFALMGKFVSPDWQRSRWIAREDPFLVVPGVGQAPDWGSLKLMDVIPPIGLIVDKLQEFCEWLNTAEKGLIKDFADLLRAKAQVIKDFADTLQDILDLLLSLLSMDGLFVLSVYGEYDGEGLKDALRHTEGGPMEVEGANFTGGLAFLATGGTSASTEADYLFDLFGLAKVVTT